MIITLDQLTAGLAVLAGTAGIFGLDVISLCGLLDWRLWGGGR